MTADDYLRVAVNSRAPTVAGGIAQRGLGASDGPIDPDAQLLLLREIYRAHLYAHRVRSAHAVARKMVRLGVMQELAWADLGRACAALGWWASAARAHRLAARNAPASRRALHWAQAGSALHHGAFFNEAVSAFDRAVRWSLTMKPLHRGQRLLSRIDRGDELGDADELNDILDDLGASRSGEGYGRYIRGLLHFARGDHEDAAENLRVFLKRNAQEPMRSVTLAAEIVRARETLRALRVARRVG